jgi:mannose-6-phosphate isomerase-like protein (cupin superfamily)
MFIIKTMRPIHGYHLIKPDDLSWRLSNLMQIPNADYLERTGSENLSARLWRLPPQSANTLHKLVRQEEFYLVLEGEGRLRVGHETLTVPTFGGVLVGPDQLRQVFNDTDIDVLWLIMGAPEELGVSARGENSARSFADLPGRPEAIARGTVRRGMAAKELSVRALNSHST